MKGDSFLDFFFTLAIVSLESVKTLPFRLLILIFRQSRSSAIQFHPISGCGKAPRKRNVINTHYWEKNGLSTLNNTPKSSGKRQAHASKVELNKNQISTQTSSFIA